MPNPFEYGSPIIYELRSGDSSDPFISYANIPYKVINNSVLLSELPVKFNKVQVRDGALNVSYYEVVNKAPLEFEFVVDYVTGIVKFNQAAEGKTLQFTGFSRGNVYFPADRVWTKQENGNVSETLGEILEAGEIAIGQLELISGAIASVEDAITSANTAISNVNTTNTNIQNAESLRVAAENTRVSQESGRVAKESLRVTVETGRVNAESARDTAELSRVAAETTRISNESTRQSQESSRQTNTTNAINNLSNTNSAFNIWEPYNNTTNYVPLNKVVYNGSTYVCKAASTGNIPTETTFWTLVSQKGDKGDKGDIGDQGIQGIQGIQGTKGDIGERGEKGDTGDQGLQGIQGLKGDTGDQGIQGLQGIQGIQGEKGDKGINWLEAYSATTSYEVDDAVYYNGSSYRCILESIGNNPSNDTYWHIIALKGTDGTGSGTVTSVSSSNGDVVVTNGDTTPDIAINPTLKTAWSGKQEALGFAPEDSANKNQANGYAGLGSDGKVLSSQLPVIEDVLWDNLTGKPSTLSGYGITDATPSSHIGSGGDAHALASQSEAGFISPENQTKLDGIAEGANNYVHPENHPASIITQDSENRFVTDAEKSVWDAKANIESPTFTGVPTAPTPSQGDNSTKLATTAYVDSAVSNVDVDAATSSTLGTVKIAANPVSGDPVVSSRTTQVSDMAVTSTAEQTLIAYTPLNKGNFVIYIYYRVVTGSTNITIKVNYDDGTGAQMNTMLNAQSSAVGSYSLIPLYINANTTAPIQLLVTANVANQVYVSSTILGV